MEVVAALLVLAQEAADLGVGDAQGSAARVLPSRSVPASSATRRTSARCHSILVADRLPRLLDAA
ncbi:hypothetical protein ACFYNO_41010 [Kitasatospora sp. NPDC006697]|uniref:hypothetical protein n=1 Tax=Kitasatospora sp. NPDC006697 TaxID=3364020 RepID=UPI0036BEDD16